MILISIYFTSYKILIILNIKRLLEFYLKIYVLNLTFETTDFSNVHLYYNRENTAQNCVCFVAHNIIFG